MNNIALLVHTSDENRQMRSLAQELLELVYKVRNEEEVGKTIKEGLPERMFEPFSEWYGGLSDSDESLKELMRELDQFRVVKIKLSFDPSEAFLEEIVSIIRKKIGEGNIVEVEVDHNVLGGIVLEIEGKFVDLSLKKIFEERYAQV